MCLSMLRVQANPVVAHGKPREVKKPKAVDVKHADIQTDHNKLMYPF